MAVINIVGICNQALTSLGANTITALNEDTKEANLCNEKYAHERDSLLRAHPWNFAIERVALATLTEEPAFEYEIVYQLPTDCLRVLATSVSSTEYKIEQGKLLSNESSVNIKYIKQITDPTKFSEDFAEALAARLAWKLAYPITASRTVAADAYQMYKDALNMARAADAQEGTPEELEADEWITARY